MVYNQAEARIERQSTYESVSEALEAYRAAESGNHFGTDLEVVLIGSTSPEAVLTTHSHYFRPSVESPWSYVLDGL
jgi:hypothetical protein